MSKPEYNGLAIWSWIFEVNHDHKLHDWPKKKTNYTNALLFFIPSTIRLIHAFFSFFSKEQTHLSMIDHLVWQMSSLERWSSNLTKAITLDLVTWSNPQGVWRLSTRTVSCLRSRREGIPENTVMSGNCGCWNYTVVVANYLGLVMRPIWLWWWWWLWNNIIVMMMVVMEQYHCDGDGGEGKELLIW